MNAKLETLKQSIRHDLNKEQHAMHNSKGIGIDSHRWNISRLEARLQGIEEACKILLYN